MIVRVVDLFERPSIVINNEESALLEYILANQQVTKKDLNERQLYLVDQLVNKNLIIRKTINGISTYSVTKRF